MSATVALSLAVALFICFDDDLTVLLNCVNLISGVMRLSLVNIVEQEE